MCDIKLLSKTPLHKHHGAEVFAAEAVPSSGIARLAAKELHTNKIDIRLMDVRNEKTKPAISANNPILANIKRAVVLHLLLC